jgi:outer membrane murein-binding lipoprotein Lpp
MAKISDLGAAIDSLASNVAAARQILTSPAAPAGDDPAVQTLLDRVNSISSDLGGAVQAYQAAHPAGT